jgi:multidrug efflux pump subunit AcrA (membrane-fusion protein)
MFAELAVVTDRKDEAIAVPLAAVLGEGAEKFVFIEEGDVYNRREIALGAKDDRYIEVKDGLFPCDIVVVQGNHELMSATGPSKVPIADDGHAHQH